MDNVFNKVIFPIITNNIKWIYNILFKINKWMIINVIVNQGIKVYQFFYV